MSSPLPPLSLSSLIFSDDLNSINYRYRYRWYHMTEPASMLLCFKQQLHLFLVIILVLLFFVQIVYNLDTEAVLHQCNLFMWKWLLSWLFMTLNIVCQLLINIHLDCHLNEVFIVIIITLWVNVTCAILDRNTRW